MKKYLILIFVIASMYGCYESDDVNSELGENLLEPRPSTDPLDGAIYDFFSTSNSVISYKYDTLDYQWNFKRNNNIYVLQDDREELLNGVNFLNKMFGDDYDVNFRKNNFPPRIFLADTLKIIGSAVKLLDVTSTLGNNHIALGKIRKRDVELTSDEEVAYKADLNATLWRYMYNSHKLNIPEAFFLVCKDRYNANFKHAPTFPEFNKIDRDKIDTKIVGFWGENPETTDDRYFKSPTESMDIYQYVYKITSTNINELEVIFKNYPKIKEKYYILIESIKKDFGIDLQEIGNAK